MHDNRKLSLEPNRQLERAADRANKQFEILLNAKRRIYRCVNVDFEFISVSPVDLVHEKISMSYFTWID